MAVRDFGSLRFSEKRDKWVIDALEPHVCIKLKSIFSQIRKTSSVPFTFDNKPDTAADLYWFIERYPLDISQKDKELLIELNRAYYEEMRKMEMILLPDISFPCIFLQNNLEVRHYQMQAYELFKRRKQLLIGDDIGLGKTLVGMLPIIQEECQPMLIVVQAHLKEQWRDEIMKFFGIKAHIIKKTKIYNLPPSPVYIMSYSCMTGWVDIFQTKFFKYACFDECQELRRRESDKYQAAKVLTANVESCMGLSASPVYNYGNEIFNVLDVLKPGCLGEWDGFKREWTTNGKIVGDPKALGTYLRENFLFLRRSRKDVGKELPPVNKIVYTVDYDHESVKDAEAIARKLAIKVTSGSFVERGVAARELDAFIRHETGVSKAKEVAAFVKILLDNGEPVLLAGWHRAVYDIWLEELKEYNPVMYTGSESPAQKQQTKDAFISGKTNLMIISLRSGVGLDGLQKRCKTVVVGELDWSPKVHDQLIGRVDRDGRDEQEQVTAMFMVSDFGSDPVLVEWLGLKAAQSHNIINPLIAVENQFTDESRIKMMAEKFLRSYAVKPGIKGENCLNLSK